MSKVTIKTIGCGGAFSEDGYLFHTSYMISVDGFNLFYDMGKDVWPWAMKKQGLKVTDVHAIIPSHTHDDHIGSISLLGLKRFDFVNKPKHYSERSEKYPAPILYLGKGLKDELWDAFKGNLKTNEGFVGTLETFFDVREIDDNEIFYFHGIKLQLVTQVHVMSGSAFMHTYGLWIDLGKDKVFITGDVQYFMPRQIAWFFNEATLILADTETFGTNLQFQEGELVYKAIDEKYYAWPTKETDPDGMKAIELMTKGYVSEPWKCLKMMSGVHATYSEWAGYESANATKLDPKVKTKIRPSHYGDSVPLGLDGFGNKVDWDAQAKKDGLGPFVKPGQVFEFETTY